MQFFPGGYEIYGSKIEKYSKDPLGLLSDILKDSKTLQKVTFCVGSEQLPGEQDLLILKIFDGLKDFNHPLTFNLKKLIKSIGQHFLQPVNFLGQEAENWIKQKIKGPHGFFEIRRDEPQTLHYFPKQKVLVDTNPFQTRRDGFFAGFRRT